MLGVYSPRKERIAMTEKEQTTTSGHDQPWGTSAHGDAERAVRSAGTGTGVGGASLAGTPAGPGRLNAEADTAESIGSD